MHQFKSFVAQAGRSLTQPQWDAYVRCLQRLFASTIPQSLIEEREKYLESEESKKQGQAAEEARAHLPFNQDACFTKCIVQLLLISAVQEAVEKFYDQLQLPHLAALLECLDRSYRFAKEFNAELGLRLKLWNEGFMSELQQLPGLTAQERESISTYLKILFRMYFAPKEGQAGEAAGLFGLCSKVLKDYCLQQSELVAVMSSKREEEARPADTKEMLLLTNLHENELERQLQNLTPIVSHIILANLLKLPDDDVSRPPHPIAAHAHQGDRAAADRPVAVQHVRDPRGQPGAARARVRPA